MISLDVFDTAIFRKVFKPSDIFKIINDEGFYDKRLEAENKARNINPYYNLDNIYKFLPGYHKNTEVEAEFSNIEANPEILEMYNKSPKSYVFISDMYLPSNIITRMLEKVGYKNPKVFVSQELGACKATGELFQKVENIIGEKITAHYGDNYIADVMGAKIANINPVFKPALRDVQIAFPEVQDPYLKNFISRALYNSLVTKNDEDIIKGIAKIMTSILLDFVKWVLSKRTSNEQKIFFLARDMKIPYLIAKEVFKAPNVEYIFASRRSMESVIRKSKDPMFNEKLDLIADNKEVSSIEEVKKYFDKFNIKENDIIVDIGYSGTALFALQELYNIKLKGLFMQKEPIMHPKLSVDMYFNRPAIKFPLLIEFFISSNEDCMIGYKNGEPVFVPDNSKRKTLAKITENTVMETVKDIILVDKKFKIFDLEQVLIYLQLYCPDEYLSVYNKPIAHNRTFRESIINFDKSKIMKGELKTLYDISYARPLFIRMLKNDKELSKLEKLLY